MRHLLVSLEPTGIGAAAGGEMDVSQPSFRADLLHVYQGGRIRAPEIICFHEL